ncbi:MAG TPA: hypothetical protein VIF09_07170 [Polyangiaceae bacterium]|jgi:alpha-tubulin suppressor-like RCC1 family protein
MAWPSPRAVVVTVLGSSIVGCTALLGIDGDYRAAVDGGGTSDGAGEIGADGSGEAHTGDAGSDTAPDAFPDSPGAVTEVTAGRFHTCARFQSGYAMCWGRDEDYGELGNGSNSSTSIPTPAMGSGIAKLVAGAHDTCALLANGAACAGKGGAGELLDDVGDADSPVPVAETALPAAPVAIASGEAFTCAVVQGGDVYCAGNGAYGVLGNGTTGISVAPVQVSLQGKKATAIAAFNDHACAVLVDGSVACWGDDTSGQLGDGKSGTGVASSSPVAVTGLPSAASSVCVGDNFSCALLGNDSSSTVWCWGDNTNGQLGNGDPSVTSSAMAVEVVGSTGAAALSCGAGHACLGNDYSKAGVWCWGNGHSGQLGNGGTSDAFTPVAVDGISAYPGSLAAGGFHTCVVLSSPNILCWGSNDFGQLGDDSPDASYDPVQAVDVP